MHRTVQVVIGANYGDEGKGLITDHLAARTAGTLVVRFNGGCQAGHTVVTPAGRRHVFSHVGSGAFTGAATFLSQHFAVNPVLYFKERPQLLAALGHLPKVYVDARAPVTTFFDMLLNQWSEAQRGAARHGSCGMGFGETIGRHEDSPFRLTVADLADPARLRDILQAIRDVYLPQRCRVLGLNLAAIRAESRWQPLLASEVLVNAFLDAAQRFLDEVEIVATPVPVFQRAAAIVMEGAQGLLLDQAQGTFPHVTRSHTGLTNVLALAAETGLAELEVTYVSRVYLTRHGAGPLPHELDRKPYAGIVDHTNLPNPHQGALRFACLDHDRLAAAIRTDLAAIRHDETSQGIRCRAGLAVTCLDQIGAEKARYWSGGQLHETSVTRQLDALNRDVAEVVCQVSGPTRTAAAWRT